MAVPYSKTNKFEINGKSFYRYNAQDSHGFCCNTFSIDGAIVTSETYYLTLYKTLGSNGDIFDIHHALQWAKLKSV